MEENSPAGYGDLIFSIIVGIFLLEIAVGAIQILGALIRTIICINNKQAIGKLKTYWIIVGVYFLLFFGLYFAQYLVISAFRLDTLSANDNYHERFQWYTYLMIALIFWVFAAWGIAIWYCIKIVFVKRKNTIEINHSLTQNI
jgi:hypothetical protein